MAETFDTIIISDLHLGSEASRARDALRMLRRHNFRRLVLLGDIFCDLNFSRLKKDHWRFLSLVRKLSNPRRRVEVVWVEGNHDQGLSHLMSHLVGIKVYKQYEWQFDGKRHLAIHGHQFDRFVLNNQLLSRTGTAVYLLLQKIGPAQRWFTPFLDRLNTAWLRLSPKVAAGALAHAAARGAQRVFCGHTHMPMQATAREVSYYNAGCWMHDTASYITISEEGVEIRHYDQPTDHRNSREERGDFDSAFAGVTGQPGLPAYAAN
jgi:UDP-2,3-diacylglucosamine pyrophosphatase LpxH